MKCPKCSYVSFEHLNRCRKCGIDLTPAKTEAKIDFPHSLPLGLLTRSETGTIPEQAEQPIGQGGELEDSESTGLGGTDFAGVASAELGTDGYNSVEDNSAGEIIFEEVVEADELDLTEQEEEEPPSPESPPSETSGDTGEREEIAFDPSSIEDLAEETPNGGDTEREKTDDDLDLSFEVEDIEDTLEEEIDTAMSTPHAMSDREEVDEEVDDILPDFEDAPEHARVNEDETLSDIVISSEKLVDTETLNLEPANKKPDMPLDKPAENRSVVIENTDVIELDIGDDELEIVSEGTKKEKKGMSEPKGLDLEDLDLTLNPEGEKENEVEDIDDMDIDFDDADMNNRDGE